MEQISSQVEICLTDKFTAISILYVLRLSLQKFCLPLTLDFYAYVKHASSYVSSIKMHVFLDARCGAL